MVSLTCFEIENGGYTLVLSRKSGERYVQIDRVFVPQQYEGITYGRLDDRPRHRHAPEGWQAPLLHLPHPR